MVPDNVLKLRTHSTHNFSLRESPPTVFELIKLKRVDALIGDGLCELCLIRFLIQPAQIVE